MRRHNTSKFGAKEVWAGVLMPFCVEVPRKVRKIRLSHYAAYVTDTIPAVNRAELKVSWILKVARNLMINECARHLLCPLE